MAELLVQVEFVKTNTVKSRITVDGVSHDVDNEDEAQMFAGAIRRAVQKAWNKGFEMGGDDFTPEQAQKELDEADPVPISEAEIQRYIDFVGRSAAWEIKKEAVCSAAKLAREKAEWVANKSDGSAFMDDTVPGWFHDLAAEIEELNTELEKENNDNGMCSGC